MRIVQDSDDELDDDVEVQPLSAEKPPMKNTSQQSHGTGSTGKGADRHHGLLVLILAQQNP